MLSIFEGIREISLFSVLMRMTFAVLCGGIIGLERAYKRRPAGFRTHILICLGATATTMTSQYILSYTPYFTDISRMGAQVIAGMGFIGAGCIIVNPASRVKGLTTAAGLWSSGIIGLALGAGFYEAAFIATVVILITELLFSRLEYYLMASVPEISLYVEAAKKKCMDRLFLMFREREVTVQNFETTFVSESGKHYTCAIFSLRLNRGQDAEQVMEWVRETEGVVTVERL